MPGVPEFCASAKLKERITTKMDFTRSTPNLMGYTDGELLEFGDWRAD
jgi:hypothetical protein